MSDLRNFVAESNKIEGILRDPTKAEIQAHERILGLPRLEIEDIQQFVATIAPGHVLRDRDGLDVYVGDHVPPPGGPSVRTSMGLLLYEINGWSDPYNNHIEYEALHPFTDGNGRSGRAIWLWGMKKAAELTWALSLGFLHSFYYQTLQDSQK